LKNPILKTESTKNSSHTSQAENFDILKSRATIFAKLIALPKPHCCLKKSKT